MAIQGSLEEAGLPDVLQLLALGAKSGCIDVSSGAMKGEIYLGAGVVVHARITSRRDRLADLMATAGRISRTDLQRITTEQAKDKRRSVSDIIVDAGVPRDELEPFVVRQMEENIQFMFTWKTGEFRFTPQRQPPPDAPLVSIAADRLLLEGGRRVDDWELIRRKVPSFDLVFRKVTTSFNSTALKDLSVEQKAVYLLLDGTRDANEIIEHTGLSDFDVGKALCGLVMAGLAAETQRAAGVRHFDGNELLAYALRQGEFEDAPRRKEVARHVADCSACAMRLQRVARETQELPAVAPPTVKVAAPRVSQAIKLSPPAIAPPKEEAPPPQPPPPPPPPPEPEPVVVEPEPEPVVVVPEPEPAPVPEPVPEPEPPPPPPRMAPRPRPSAPVIVPPAPKRRWWIPVSIAAALAGVAFAAWRMMPSAPQLAAAATAPRDTAPVAPPPPPPAPAPVQDTSPRVAAAVAPAPPTTPAPTPVAEEEREDFPPVEPDAGLNSGGWTVTDHAEAIASFGGPYVAIPGLHIETIAMGAYRGGTRLRIAQVTDENQRIVLIETRTDGDTPAGARSTGVSVTPPSEGFAESIGSANVANIQVTARALVDGSELRRFLNRLRVRS